MLQFARLTEELALNPDEFDLGYYAYGLSLYGNLPLIEPLETSERKRLRDWIVVIDTSYSTSGELVLHFLRETFAILKERELFLRISKIRVLQCDDRVREERVLRTEADRKGFLRGFALRGGGGTDFRPAFAYARELLKSGETAELGGLLYFTDGEGTYPEKKPPFPAAFVFLHEFDESRVPVWAYRLRLPKP